MIKVVIDAAAHTAADVAYTDAEASAKAKAAASNANAADYAEAAYYAKASTADVKAAYDAYIKAEALYDKAAKAARIANEAGAADAADYAAYYAKAAYGADAAYARAAVVTKAARDADGAYVAYANSAYDAQNYAKADAKAGAAATLANDEYRATETAYAELSVAYRNKTSALLILCDASVPHRVAAYNKVKAATRLLKNKLQECINLEGSYHD